MSLRGETMGCSERPEPHSDSSPNPKLQRWNLGLGKGGECSPGIQALSGEVLNEVLTLS